MTIPKLMPFEAIVCDHCGLLRRRRSSWINDPMSCGRQAWFRSRGISNPKYRRPSCHLHRAQRGRGCCLMSQAALGQTSAVNRSMISRLENGHAVSLMVLLRLAAGLGVEEIYFRVGNGRSKSG